MTDWTAPYFDGLYLKRWPIGLPDAGHVIPRRVRSCGSHGFIRVLRDDRGGCRGPARVGTGAQTRRDRSARNGQWSDIDLRILVRPEAHADYLAKRVEHPKQWGDLAFNVCHPGTIHCVSHFRPFTKVDVFYHRSDRYEPSPWHSLPHRILHDPEGILAKVIAASTGLTFAPKSEHVMTRINFGIATAHEVYRRAHRGELIYAQNLLDSLRHILAELDACSREQPFMNIERNASPRIVEALHASYVTAERDEILRALTGLCGLLKVLIAELHEKYELPQSLDVLYGEIDRVASGPDR